MHMVVGPPGCGKTSSLLRWIHKQSETFGASSVVACSYTRTAAHELASKSVDGSSLDLPKENVGTLHSMVYRALGNPKLTIGREKEFCQETGINLTVEKSKKTDEPMSDDQGGQPTNGDILRQKYEVLRARMVPREAWPEEVAGFAVEWEKWKDAVGLLDFGDLIEVAIRDLDRFPGEPAIGVLDEGQDSTRVQLALIEKWSRDMVKFIVAGDVDQSIYGWAGACPEALVELPIPIDRRMTLAQSYRVPRAVHAYSEKLVRTIGTRFDREYRPRDEEGELRWVQGDFRRPANLIGQARRKLAEGDSVLFLSTAAYLLTPLLMELRNAGIPFSNPWRRRRSDWNPYWTGDGRTTGTMMRRLMALLTCDMPPEGSGADPQYGKRLWTGHELFLWASKLKAVDVFVRGGKTRLEELCKGRGEEVGIDVLEQVFLPEIVNGLGEMRWDTPESIREFVRWWIRRMPAEDARRASMYDVAISKLGPDVLSSEPLCHVGTAHSVKGGEADHVYLDVSLSPAAWQDSVTPGPRADGIKRMLFVAMTRARKSLTICVPQRGGRIPVLPRAS